MDERSLMISAAEGVELEARFARGQSQHGAVLAHPHPLYGGAMDNNVVIAARDALAALGFSTMRFNFRGVGQSSGVHDEGRGEERDLAAAFERLGEEVDQVHLVAYSFGARVAAGALSAGRLRPETVTLISPPVEFMDHGGLSLPALPTLVVSGDRDQFGGAGAVDAWLEGQSELLGQLTRVTLPGVDHFYAEGEAALKQALIEFLRPRR